MTAIAKIRYVANPNHAKGSAEGSLAMTCGTDIALMDAYYMENPITSDLLSPDDLLLLLHNLTIALHLIHLLNRWQVRKQNSGRH